MIKKNFIHIFLCIFFWTPASAVEVKTPFIYTAMIMAADFAILNTLDETQNSISVSNFRQAWEEPVPRKDDDNFLYNYVLHPLMGSESYLRAREADFGVPGSIAFSMGASLVWEYLIESWTEHPSTQDLIFTTGIGWILGELRYAFKQEYIKSKQSYFWVDPIWATLEYLDFKITKKEDVIKSSVIFSVPL